MEAPSNSVSLSSCFFKKKDDAYKREAIFDDESKKKVLGSMGLKEKK